MLTPSFTERILARLGQSVDMTGLEIREFSWGDRSIAIMRGSVPRAAVVIADRHEDAVMDLLIAALVPGGLELTRLGKVAQAGEDQHREYPRVYNYDTDDTYNCYGGGHPSDCACNACMIGG